MVLQGVQSPRHSLHDTVMCELDVASFTSGRQAEEAGVPADHRGKYLGLLDRLDLIRWAVLNCQAVHIKARLPHIVVAFELAL